MMGRYYRLSKKITDAMANEILEEIKELEPVKRAGFTPDRRSILIETQEAYYPEVMGKAVNIFRRAGNGCELSFCGFEESKAGV